MLNFQGLKKAREDMVQLAIDSLAKDEELKSSWINCFQGEDNIKNKVND